MVNEGAAHLLRRAERAGRSLPNEKRWYFQRWLAEAAGEAGLATVAIRAAAEVERSMPTDGDNHDLADRCAWVAELWAQVGRETGYRRCLARAWEHTLALEPGFWRRAAVDSCNHTAALAGRWADVRLEPSGPPPPGVHYTYAWTRLEAGDRAGFERAFDAALRVERAYGRAMKGVKPHPPDYKDPRLELRFARERRFDLLVRLGRLEEAGRVIAGLEPGDAMQMELTLAGVHGDRHELGVARRWLRRAVRRIVRPTHATESTGELRGYLEVAQLQSRLAMSADARRTLARAEAEHARTSGLKRSKKAGTRDFQIVPGVDLGPSDDARWRAMSHALLARIATLAGDSAARAHHLQAIDAEIASARKRRGKSGREALDAMLRQRLDVLLERPDVEEFLREAEAYLAEFDDPDDPDLGHLHAQLAERLGRTGRASPRELSWIERLPLASRAEVYLEAGRGLLRRASDRDSLRSPWRRRRSGGRLSIARHSG